jgi:hypothetical protein
MCQVAGRPADSMKPFRLRRPFNMHCLRRWFGSTIPEWPGWLTGMGWLVEAIMERGGNVDAIIGVKTTLTSDDGTFIIS